MEGMTEPTSGVVVRISGIQIKHRAQHTKHIMHHCYDYCLRRLCGAQWWAALMEVSKEGLQVA